MFGNTYTLFRFLGFEVRANVSWLFLAILVTWSLAAGFFPGAFPGLAPGTYWMLGLVGMFGLFFSILFHEFAHSLEARRRGLHISGITLFIFGGAAEMIEEPPSPAAEFWIAIVGPLSSVLLAAIFWTVGKGMDAAGAPAPAVGLVTYLALLNVILAVFNLLPAFPLDGGRVLRAGLWQWTGNIRSATRTASWGGRFLGYALIALGFLALVEGGIITGIWWILIGLFLAASAKAAYERLLLHEDLKGRTVAAMMTRNPVTAPADMTVRRFVDDLLTHYTFDLFPVVRDGILIGCVGKEEVRHLPRDEWADTPVGAILKTCTPGTVVTLHDDTARALDRMQSVGTGRLLVVDGDRLVGILVLKDLLHHLSLRRELGDARGHREI